MFSLAFILEFSFSFRGDYSIKDIVMGFAFGFGGSEAGGFISGGP
jgi:hypothetical protein